MAVISIFPVVVGVHEHVATLLSKVTFSQPVIDVPFAKNLTVPVVPEVTVACKLYVVPERAGEGIDPRVTVVEDHVAVCRTERVGRFDAFASTGVTRTSYWVPAVSPVIVALVRDELAVWLHVVHVESVDFLYSTVKSETSVLSVGRVHVAVRRSVAPVDAVPVLLNARFPTPITPVSTSDGSYPNKP